MGSSTKITRKGLFVTGTDTGVGKTVITLGILTILKQRGIDVALMKPVQCAGDDAQFLKKKLGLKDPLSLINPFYAKEPLAPELAFRRAGRNIDISKIIEAYKKLEEKHDFIIVEGVGGLLVPLKKDYLISDLIRELGLPIIIVARLGLGTINHTLLTVREAQALGIKLLGLILNNTDGKYGASEKTNPDVVAKLIDVPVLGVIPYLSNISKENLIKRFSCLNLNPIFEGRGDLKTKDLIELDKKYLWHPFTQMKDWLGQKPLIIDEARGCYLKDIDGKWYLDGVSSLWVNVHGHRHKELDLALKQQIDKVSHSTLLGLSNIPAIEFAKELVKIAPRGLNKVFYSDSGSTAVEIALKIAYQYWQQKGRHNKTKFIHLGNSYHGDTIGAVSVGGIELFHKIYQPLLFKSFKVCAPYCYRCPENRELSNCAFECLLELENILKNKHNQIAALIIEPIVQAAAGIIVWPKGILKRMRVLCLKYNVLLIADEVATGFGRTGKMFSCEHENISPDILCLGKGISAGYLPLAATLTTDEIYNAFLGEYAQKKTFFHGHTYTGNPLACSVALANLRIFKKEKTLRHMVPKIAFLKERLWQFSTLSHIGDIRQKGLMVGIELVKNKNTKEIYLWEERIGIKVCQQIRKYGVILRPLGNTIVLMPPLAITKQELRKMLNATFKAIKKVTED